MEEIRNLHPNLKTGVNFSADEERQLIELQREFGNKWERIAKYFRGRTNYHVKNFWRNRQRRLVRALRKLPALPPPSPPTQKFRRCLNAPPVLRKLPTSEVNSLMNNLFLTKKKTMISSSRSHGEKQIRKPDRKPKATTDSLPKDLLVNVLAKVASSSFTDLFNAKLWDYLEAAEDEYIFQHVSIEKFPIVDWVPPPVEKLSFLARCFCNGNPRRYSDEEWYIKYFSLTRVESGLEYLKKATEKSLPEATYAFGMLLLSRGDKSGLNLLNSGSRDWNTQDCRDKVKSVLSQIWVKNKIPPQPNFFNCHPVEIRGFDQQAFGCDSCMWYRELRVFSKIVNGA
ncbi:hypothetical protein OSB04_009155 [Centaurea solstitialis]|uniref:Uncharacterized protein n=1 Tax=Centaurea solstitialis TaxID=347529 RepID=A0AA38TZX0_9ASTR|nr:hypothetical protein OSB04_009155 [Centaurea solstitialis]